MSVAQFLATVSGFSVIEPDDLEQISALMEQRVFRPGQYLIRRGEPGDAMYVIRNGHVRVPLLDSSGNERSVFRLAEGDCVGEMALLTGEPRNADVIAETDVRAVVIHRAVLRPMLGDYPQLAGFLTEILGKRLEEGGSFERVGKYRLLGKIGEGASSKVYEALHPGLGRVVAVKMLAHSLSYDPAFCDRFLEEARLVAGLTHPNIVQVYDTEAAWATWFIVMEKVAGTDLARLLWARGALPPAEAAAILRQLAAALAFAHSRGIVHRDVKPANVAIDDQGHVKLMDFGLARPIPREPGAARARSIEGTPQYVAPETATGRQADGRADIYAFGVMAFEMLTGRLPFLETNVVALLKAHICDAPPDIAALRPELPPSLVELVRGTLAKRPEDRLSDWERIDRLLDLDGSAGLGPASIEELVRLRFPPEASGRVERALQTLAAELGREPGVELARARLEAAKAGGR
jgi:serine/threonine-protein kinase